MKNFKGLIIVGIATASILTIAIIIGLASLLISLQNNSSSNVLNDEDISVIAELIRFSDTESESFVYQSPLFDFSANINTKTYNYQELYNGISVTTKDYQDTVYVYAQENTDNSTLEEAYAYEKSSLAYTDNFSIANEEDIKIDGKDAKKIIYTYKNFADEPVSVAMAVIVSGDYIYSIEYTSYKEGAPDYSMFVSIVGGIRFIDSSLVNDIASYESSLWGYSYSYDAKYWVLNHSDYSSSLIQREFPDSGLESIRIDFSSSEVLRSQLMGNESSFLQDYVEEQIGEIASSTYDSNTIIGHGDIELDGRVAKYVIYSTEETSEYIPEFHKIIYVLHYNTLTQISVTYGKDDLLPYFDSLFASMTFREPSRGIVKGVATSTSTDEKVAILAKPAVVQIFMQKCGELNLAYDPSYPNTTGKTYDICAAGTGSGFFINSDGYVATNGHVVSMSKEDFADNAISIRLIIGLFRDLILPKMVEQDPTYAGMTDDEIFSYLRSNPRDLYDLISFNSLFINQLYSSMNIEDSVYIQKGINPYELNDDTYSLANASDFYLGEVVDMDYDPYLSSTGQEQSSDVAIVKIADGDYPMLHLGSNEFTVAGTQIFAVGFPGAADMILMDTEAESQETFTRGIVSRLTQTTGSRTLLQIDASINHGNSGGPVIKVSDGTVLGLATYGNDAGSSDFNFARDVKDLKDLMDKNSITNKAGVTQQKMEEGINYFFDGYFSKAVESLGDAKESYEDIEGLQTIIDLAKEKIAQGLDKKEEEPQSNDIWTYINNLSGTEKILFIVVTILVCVVIFIFFMMIIVFGKLRKNKREEALKQNLPPRQNPPTAPITKKIEQAPASNTIAGPITPPSNNQNTNAAYFGQQVNPYMPPQQAPTDIK